MTYTSAEGRQELLDTVAQAADHLGEALACLSELYELLDERTAETLERELFRPVQTAYGRIQQTHTAFALRHGLPARQFAPGAPGHPGQGAQGFLESAVAAAAEADASLAELQDSMLPVEVGDEQLRAGLSQVRLALDGTAMRARELQRRLGR